MRRNHILISATIASAILVGVAATMSLSNIDNNMYIGADPEQDTVYTLDGSKKDTTLPTKDNASASTHTQTLDEKIHIEYFFATKHDSNTHFVRLNNRSSSDKAYFRKVEPCYGMSQFTINLNYGYVSVYIGYEPNSYSYKYDISCGIGSNNEPNQSVTKTINADGNYFKVVNENSSTNAIVTSFSVTYGCREEREISNDYPIVSGQKTTIFANPGKWYYWENSNTSVGESSNTDRGFTSIITNLNNSSEGVYYRYQPAPSGTQLTSSYKITFKIKLNVTGVVRIMGTNYPAATDTWVSYSGTHTVKTDPSKEDPFMLKVLNTNDTVMPEGGIVVTMAEVLIARTAA